jgi:hypothetical protein
MERKKLGRPFKDPEGTRKRVEAALKKKNPPGVDVWFSPGTMAKIVLPRGKAWPHKWELLDRNMDNGQQTWQGYYLHKAFPGFSYHQIKVVLTVIPFHSKWRGFKVKLSTFNPTWPEHELQAICQEAEKHIKKIIKLRFEKYFDGHPRRLS